MLNKSLKSSVADSDHNFNFLIEDAITKPRSDPYETNEDAEPLSTMGFSQPDKIQEEDKVE